MKNRFDTAIELCALAHRGQTDKGGKPYIFHPMTVASKFKDENLQIIALLHDVVEDSNYSLHDLERAGFSKTIVDGVDALTRRENETYEQFIERVSQNKLATKVKIEDMKHNSDLNRIENPNEDDLKRVEKYSKYINYLESKINN